MRILGWGLAAVAYASAIVGIGKLIPHPSPSVNFAYVPLNSRAEFVQKGFTSLETLYNKEVRPLERVVFSRSGNPSLSRQVAWSIYRNAHMRHIPVDLALGMALVENPSFNPRARSSSGAIGIMQVMPGHAGNWRPCGANLENVEHNICSGLSIYRELFLEAGGDTHKALLAYNGCVRGTNTPDCANYPSWVLAKAKVARQYGYKD